MGYISSLRLAEQYRNRLLGFYAKAFYRHQLERGRKISLMTIFEDNLVAKKNLLSGKGRLPSMKDLGQIHTLIFKPVIRNEKEKQKAYKKSPKRHTHYLGKRSGTILLRIHYPIIIF